MQRFWVLVGSLALLSFGAQDARADFPSLTKKFHKAHKVEVVKDGTHPCKTIENPERTGGLVTDPPVNSDNILIQLSGPGCFLSAFLTKQGGTNDITFVILEIDGRDVVNTSIAGLLNLGLTGNNPSGVSVHAAPSGIDAVTIGFQTPLTFDESLILRAVVGDGDAGIVQILGNVVTGE